MGFGFIINSYLMLCHCVTFVMTHHLMIGSLVSYGTCATGFALRVWCLSKTWWNLTHRCKLTVRVSLGFCGTPPTVSCLFHPSSSNFHHLTLFISVFHNHVKDKEMHFDDVVGYFFFLCSIPGFDAELSASASANSDCDPLTRLTTLSAVKAAGLSDCVTLR